MRSRDILLDDILKRLNSTLDVDIVDATGITITADTEFPAAVALTDNFANPTTTSVASMLMAWDTATWDRVQIGGGTEAAALRVTIASNSTGVVSIDDNAGSITVDNAGTFAVQIDASENHLGSVGGVSANPSANFTRPANTTAYEANDLIANSTTAASVVAMSFTAARVAAGSFIVRKARLHKTNAAVANANFRLHLFNANPVATAPTAGDNSSIELNAVIAGQYVGAIDLDMTTAPDILADGLELAAVPNIGSEITVDLPAGTALFGLLEARAAYTPISGEIFTVTLEILQD